LARDLGLDHPTAIEASWLSQLATLTLRAAELQLVLERAALTAKRAAELTKVSSESRRLFALLRREPEAEPAWWEQLHEPAAAQPVRQIDVPATDVPATQATPAAETASAPAELPPEAM
jgi:hypothetical protein